MHQDLTVAKLPDLIDVERKGEVVRLSWNHRGPNPRTMIFEGMLVTVLLLLSFGWLVDKNRFAGPWILLSLWIFGALVGCFAALTALRWFWDESIELRSETVTQVFSGPLAPRSKEFRRSEIVNISLIRNSENDPQIRLTHRGWFFHRHQLIGVFLSLEQLQVLEVHLRDWLSRPDNQAKKDITGELSDIWP
jgi:hypothetical protein